MNKETLRWFFRGFVLTALVLFLALALVKPNLGMAQQGVNNSQDQAAGEAQSGALSDHPAGVMGSPVGDTPTGTNNDVAGEKSGAEAIRSDDPAGRSLVTAPEDAGISNPEAMRLFDGEPGAAGVEGVNAALQSLVIPAADFRSDGVVPAGFMFWFAGGYMYGEDAASTCVMAPAYLPQGVNVQQFFVSAVDNDATNDMTFYLWRVDNYAGDTSVMATAATSGASTSIQSPGDTTITDPVVSYPTYSYYVTTCISDADFKFYSVRLWY